ncbi:MAG: ABC transporter ATP-binding protein [Clostridia bacterium]
MTLAIEMKNITKKFPGVIANNKVNLSIKSQEIHSLLGENGAGKTTLMNILFGIYEPDEGSVFIKGQAANIKNPKTALDMGIGMVHQHFMLVDRMTILENIILGYEHGKFLLDMKKSYEIINELSKKFKFNLELNTKVEDLSVGMKQRVEILKTLYRGADIIILDEPTAVLTPTEVDELFIILNELKKRGKTIIFITHKLNETMEIADRITVLRDGRNIKTLSKNETNEEKLARLMVGREINFNLKKEDYKPGDALIALKELKLLDKAKQPVNLEIYEGEILGIAGVEGNGQLELEEMLMGLRSVKNGSIYLNGKDITRLPTKKRKLLGLGYIPSDRHKRAMLGSFSIEENFLLGFHFHPPFFKKGLLQRKILKKHSVDMIEKFDIKTPSAEQKIKLLSGGNQQKVIISREISQEPVFVLAAQPTRGLDIGAIEYIHSVLLELRNKGKAVLLISADLNEVMKISDRIAVIYEGEIRALKPAEEYTYEEFGLLMAGKEGNINK